MMNYKLVQTGMAVVPGTDGKFMGPVYDILETATDQVVASSVQGGTAPNQAKALCRHLNMGGGFDGKTPSFFLNAIAHPNLVESFG